MRSRIEPPYSRLQDKGGLRTFCGLKHRASGHKTHQNRSQTSYKSRPQSTNWTEALGLESSALCAPPKTPKIRPKTPTIRPEIPEMTPTLPNLAPRVVPKIGLLRAFLEPHGALWSLMEPSWSPHGFRFRDIYFSVLGLGGSVSGPWALGPEALSGAPWPSSKIYEV